MRWEELFRDLDDTWDAVAGADLRAEVAERTRAELARTGLLDRLRGAVGHRLVLHTPCGQRSGELARVAADCVLLRNGSCELLLPTRHITGIEGLPNAVVPPDQVGRVELRLGLASLLRQVVRDRAAVTIERVGCPAVHGTPLLAGADFVEVAVHEYGVAPRASTVRSRQVVPLAAIAIVRRDP